MADWPGASGGKGHCPRDETRSAVVTVPELLLPQACDQSDFFGKPSGLGVSVRLLKTTRNAAPAGARDRGWHRDRGYVGAGGAGAKHARPTGHSALCWPHGLARRERHKTPGARAGPFRQRATSATHDPIGVAISHLSEEQHLGAVVSSPHRERARYAQAHDRPWRKLLIALWRLVREGVG